MRAARPLLHDAALGHHHADWHTRPQAFRQGHDVLADVLDLLAVLGLDGKGKSDILWRNSNGDTVIWFLNGGTITASTDLGTVPSSWTVAGVRDYNGDGKSDILWRNSSGDAVIWFMNGGAVASSTDLGVVPTSWTIVGGAGRGF